MSLFYVEASAFVKHYLPEAGSDVVSELLVAPAVTDRFYTSLLSIVEVTAAMYRQVRAAQLREPRAQEAVAHLRRTLSGLFGVWPLSIETMSAAVAAAEGHRLRAGDAIHLATALATAALAAPDRLVLVSSDGELAQAAAAAGLAVLDPAGPGALASLRGLRA
jgi:uncharacterized protein